MTGYDIGARNIVPLPCNLQDRCNIKTIYFDMSNMIMLLLMVMMARFMAHDGNND